MSTLEVSSKPLACSWDVKLYPIKYTFKVSYICLLSLDALRPSSTCALWRWFLMPLASLIDRSYRLSPPVFCFRKSDEQSTLCPSHNPSRALQYVKLLPNQPTGGLQIFYGAYVCLWHRPSVAEYHANQYFRSWKYLVLSYRGGTTNSPTYVLHMGASYSRYLVERMINFTLSISHPVEWGSLLSAKASRREAGYSNI